MVETVAESGPSDGLLWDGADGIFISAIEDDAVKQWSPEAGVEIVIQDPADRMARQLCARPRRRALRHNVPDPPGPNPPSRIEFCASPDS